MHMPFPFWAMPSNKQFPFLASSWDPHAHALPLLGHAVKQTVPILGIFVGPTCTCPSPSGPRRQTNSSHSWHLRGTHMHMPFPFWATPSNKQFPFLASSWDPHAYALPLLGHAVKQTVPILGIF